MKKLIAAFFILTGLIILAAGGLYYYMQTFYDDKINSREPVIIDIPRGTSISGAINAFNDKGLLRPGWVFEASARIYSYSKGTGMKAGYYRFPDTLTNSDLIEAIFKGEFLYTVNITFPEGYSYKKYAQLAAEKMFFDENEFLRLCESDSLLSTRGIDAVNAEGYLLPDTYEFFANATAANIVDRMLSARESFFQDILAKDEYSLYKSVHETLTLASIIEAESPVDAEKRAISGVYRNRLEIGMLLQADPTVQFALGEKRRLLYRDLEINNPYNTYKVTGLPPGPINNPGRESIKAAMDPLKHDYYYFVAVGDGSGMHNFAETHAGHIRNIRIFKRNAR
ncbi:MAG: endolytic transglycosylase MltG [Candidatus Kapaibacterium sp.]